MFVPFYLYFLGYRDREVDCNQLGRVGGPVLCRTNVDLLEFLDAAVLVEKDCRCAEVSVLG
jgi:hypothetical protein